MESKLLEALFYNKYSEAGFNFELIWVCYHYYVINIPPESDSIRPAPPFFSD